MNFSDPKLIRGFGIANIVLSALAILAFVLFGALVGILGSAMSDPSVSSEITRSLHNDPQFMYDLDELYSYGYSDVDLDDIMSVVMLVTGGLGIVVGLGAVLSIISLIAGIMAVRFYNKPEKSGLLFGWSIAGAVCALICGRIISTVLLVLQTICAHKQRQIAAGEIPVQAAMPMNHMGVPAGQQPYGYGYPNNYPAGYAPHNGYPQHPYGALAPNQVAVPAPGAPAAGPAVAPHATAQPIPNAHPGMPSAAPAPMPHPAPAAQPIPNTAPVETPGEAPVTSPATAATSEESAPEKDNETK